MRSAVVPSTETRCWGCMIRVTSTAGAPAKDLSAPEAEMNCKPCRWPPEESQQKTALYFPNYDTCLLFSWAVWTHSPWWHHSSTPDTWLKRQTLYSDLFDLPKFSLTSSLCHLLLPHGLPGSSHRNLSWGHLMCPTTTSTWPSVIPLLGRLFPKNYGSAFSHLQMPHLTKDSV